jgi:hypothetical protein
MYADRVTLLSQMLDTRIMIPDDPRFRRHGVLLGPICRCGHLNQDHYELVNRCKVANCLCDGFVVKP